MRVCGEGVCVCVCVCLKALLRRVVGNMSNLSQWKQDIGHLILLFLSLSAGACLCVIYYTEYYQPELVSIQVLQPHPHCRYVPVSCTGNT